MDYAELIEEARIWLAGRYPTHCSELEADYEEGVRNVANLIHALTASEAENARLREALERIVGSGGLFAEPASGQHAREIARQALTGGQ